MQNGTIIQYFHWYLPDDGTLWKQLAEQAKWLKKIGLTAVWIPPACKGASGGLSVGYDVYDLFDLGEFDQKSSIRTKYGTRQELEQAAKAVKKAGLLLYMDVVLNHKGGGDETEKFMAVEVEESNRNKMLGKPQEIEAYTKFNFPGRGNTYSSFKWDHTCFTGVDYAVNLNKSGVFNIQNGHGTMWENMTSDEKVNYDYLMYCDIEFRNKLVREECKFWARWLFDLLQFDGVRLDAIKHINPGFYNEWLDDLRAHAQKEIFAVGEYWAPGRLDLLEGYLAATEGRMSLLDSALHHKLHQASKGGKDFDLRTLWDDDSLAKANAGKAVTVVENHDTQPLQALEAPVDPWFKPHAYAFILLREAGYPVVFYPDLMSATYWDTGSDGNQYEIYIPKVDNLEALIKVRSELAYGMQRDYFDHGNTIGWTRAGTRKKNSGCAVLLCNGDDGFKKMEIGKKHAGRTFVDITGYRKEEVIVDENGWGEFLVAAGKIAVWVRKESIPIFSV